MSTPEIYIYHTYREGPGSLELATGMFEYTLIGWSIASYVFINIVTNYP